MRKIVSIMVLLAAFVLPSIAQFGSQDRNELVFQSTSTMQGSGSAYSATPTLNAEGTATDPSVAASGPRRAPGTISTETERTTRENGSGTELPIGDAVLPLMLMAAAGAGIIALRRRRAVIGK